MHSSQLTNISQTAKIHMNSNQPSGNNNNSHIVYTHQNQSNILNQSHREDSRNYDSPNINQHVNNSVDYYYLHQQRNPNPHANHSFRSYPHQIPEGSLEAYIHLLEQQLQNTTYNYQSMLQTERKASAQRSDFLLYLIQSLKMRHAQQLQSLKIQLDVAESERQQAKALENQMKNIGQGVDEVLEESKRLKKQNQQLQKQLTEQQLREKEVDQQLEAYHKEIEECRSKIDEWERAKLKLNRQRKDLIQLIQETERVAGQTNQKISSQRGSYQSSTRNKNSNQEPSNPASGQLANSGQIKVDIDICPETGIQQQNCEHCQQNNFEQLFTKYRAQN